MYVAVVGNPFTNDMIAFFGPYPDNNPVLSIGPNVLVELQDTDGLESNPEGDIIIISGNPVDGFSLYGPYDDYEAVQEEIENWQDTCWIADLTKSEETWVKVACT